MLKKFIKSLRLTLAFLMVVGNPAPWLGLALSMPMRVVLPAFLGTLFLSARAKAASILSPKSIDFSQITLSDTPSDGEFLSVKCFDTLLVPMNKPLLENENHDLSQALQKTNSDKTDESLQILENFTLSYPDSRWVLAVEVNRGLALYRRGYFSGAMDAFQKAWNVASDAESKGLAGDTKFLSDRALAELIRMDSRVGRMDDMKNLLAKMKNRHPQGVAGRWYGQAKDALWIMENQPGKAFFCGPYALRNILSFQKSARAKDRFFLDTESPQKGFSLEQVYEFSQQLGMGMQMARRDPGSRVITPCVVNWKLNHYAALVEEQNGYLHLMDPTFGSGDIWVSEKALDAEASGYFLVPNGPLPAGWTAVGFDEAGNVWGKGNVTGGIEPPPFCILPKGGSGGASGAPSTPGSPCGSHGMPNADVELYSVSAMLEDTPLFYQAPVGPPMDFTLTYHQKTPDPMVGSNFGSNWSFNWSACVANKLTPEGCISVNNPFCYLIPVLVPPGGGEENFDLGVQSQYTHSLITLGLGNSYTRQLPDGSKEEYGFLFSGETLLTQITDSKGNVVTINYDSFGRISTIVDALNQTSTFSYTLSGVQNGVDYSYLITQISDPFGRSANFQYDNQGRLQTITDMKGLTTSFTYNPPSALAGDWIGSMTTPYGTTNFDYTGSDNNGVHELEITDPLGSKEHARYSEQPQHPTDEAAPVPSGLLGGDGSLYYRNTFFWGKKAMVDAPLQASSAKVYHWLHTPESKQAAILESIKNPLESRIWYNYPGQTNPVFESSDTMVSTPSVVARIFVDANGTQSTQEFQYSYNVFGKVTGYTDPKGRVFTYTYDTNNTDLLTVQAGTAVIAQYGGYVNHQPATYTDAAGKIWNYGYNGAGQLTSVGAPGGETTAYNYTGGYLTSVVPPQPGAGVTFTYDGAGRVYTRSDAANGTLTYTYDNLNRVTEIDYPDQSNEQYGYDKLDVVSFKDRSNRTTGYGYDADRHLTSVTDPKTQTTNYEWCSCGSLTKITDPKGNHTSFNRDLEGRVTKKIYQDNSFYDYQYDAGDGQLTFVTDPKHQITQYNYDLDDKLIGVSYFNVQNSTPNVTLAYNDPVGRLTSMSDGTGTSSYSYYAFGSTGGGNLQSVSRPVGGTVANITFGIDSDGRVTSRTIDGTGETYGFSGGELTSVTNSVGSFTYGYNSSTAQLSNVQYPNGQAVTFDYFTPSDPLGSGRLKDITNTGAGSTSGQTLSKFTYQYNPAGEITNWVKQLDNTPADAVTLALGYDQASQLQAVTQTANNVPSQSTTFGYDSSGNRTLEQTSTFTHSFDTNNLNQLTDITPNPIHLKGGTDRPSTITVNSASATEDTNNLFETDLPPVSGTSTPLTIRSIDKVDGVVTTKKNHVLNTQPFTYDANGNLIQDNEKIYSWDSANRLVRVSFLSPKPIGIVDTVLFSYDGIGRRTAITEKHGSTVLTDKRFVWCGAQLCEERNVAGSSITKRFYSLGEQISGTSYYYTKDHLGSVREMVDGSGAVHDKYDYDAWGRQTKINGDLDASFGYTGFYQNKTSGLSLTWFRAYDAEKGRWLSPDPLGEGEGPNLYAMTWNDPVNYIDPWGLCVDGDNSKPNPTPSSNLNPNFDPNRPDQPNPLAPYLFLGVSGNIPLYPGVGLRGNLSLSGGGVNFYLGVGVVGGANGSAVGGLKVGNSPSGWTVVLNGSAGSGLGLSGSYTVSENGLQVSGGGGLGIGVGTSLTAGYTWPLYKFPSTTPTACNTH